MTGITHVRTGYPVSGWNSRTPWPAAITTPAQLYLRGASMSRRDCTRWYAALTPAVRTNTDRGKRRSHQNPARPQLRLWNVVAGTSPERTSYRMARII